MTLLLLAAAAVVTSCISAIIGMLGGIILLTAMMALLLGQLPYVAIIYLHGITQLGSNAVRTFAYRRHIDRRAFLLHAAAATVAAPFGYLALRQLLAGHEAALRIAFGLFVLAMTWLPPARVIAWIQRRRPLPPEAEPRYLRPGWRHLWPLAVSGLVVGGVTFFFGATGPLIAPFFRRLGYVKEPLIATKAAVQAWTHLAKTLLLGAGAAMVAGGPRVSLAEHWPIAAVLLPGVVAGTYLGKRLQRRVGPRLFVRLFEAALTAAALELIVQGWRGP